MLQCWRRTGHLPSFFVPTPGDLTAQESPPPGICHPRRKKMLMPGGQPGGGLGAAGIDWWIAIGTYTITSVFLPAMILYFTDAGRIKQRILCCRKFIIIFGSSDLFIEQLLALAECRLLMLSFRARQKYCILSLLSLGRFSEGILINISSKKNALVRVFALSSDYPPFGNWTF